jgi:hypothetical protein
VIDGGYLTQLSSSTTLQTSTNRGATHEHALPCARAFATGRRGGRLDLSQFTVANTRRRYIGHPGSLGSFVGTTLNRPIITWELPKDAPMDGDSLWKTYGEALIAALRLDDDSRE